MNEYISSIITTMRQALALVGDTSYRIPVICVLLYAESDVYALQSMGRVNNEFTIQDLAEEYFGMIIDDITAELGAEDIRGFNFVIKAAIEYGVQTSTILMYVDTKSGWNSKKSDLQAKAEQELFTNTQQKYLEDMINRSAKKYLNR